MTDITRKFLPMILLGDSQVGKTSLSLKAVNNEFNEDTLSTAGKEVYEKKVNVEGHDIKIKIHDTAGQERYRSIALSSIRNALGIVLVYAINKKETFETLNQWIEQINNADKSKPIILVGNKCDLSESREVTYEEGEKYASEHGFHFYECSAKNGDNIDKAFDDIILQMYKKHEKEFIPTENIRISKSNYEKEKGKKRSKC